MFRYSVTNGIAEQPKSLLGSNLALQDGTTTLLQDLAIPSHQFENLTISDRAALPSQGFV